MIKEEYIAIQTLISILGLFVIYFFLYRDYRRDLHRERLFALRDRLFLFAASGKVDFESPAYGLLRMLINSSIRHTHTIGAIESLLLYFMTRKNPRVAQTQFREKWKVEVDKLPQEAQNQLNEIHHELHYLVFKQMVATSYFAILLFTPVFLAIGLWMTVGYYYRRFAFPSKKKVFDYVMRKYTNIAMLAYDESQQPEPA